MPFARRSVRIFVAEARIPSLASSPRILRHPHPRFSLPIRRMNSRTSLPIGGLPPAEGRLKVHFLRTSSRCHRRSVWGLTTSIDHRARGRTPRCRCAGSPARRSGCSGNVRCSLALVTRAHLATEPRETGALGFGRAVRSNRRRLVRAEDVRSVGVVGCGLMGSGIVEVCARAGCDVSYVEPTEELVAAGRARIDRSVGRAVERGKLEAADAEHALGRIAGATDLGALAGSDLVIEAVAEDLETKLDVFRKLEGLTRPEVVLASNTSSIPIVELALATGRPDKVVGTHFFNPPPVMKLLELIPALTTSEETLAFARAFGER